jgi:hypothetical protein
LEEGIVNQSNSLLTCNVEERGVGVITEKERTIA